MNCIFCFAGQEACKNWQRSLTKNRFSDLDIMKAQ